MHPLGLVTKGTVWYLIGDTEAGLRTFRVNRVTSVMMTEDPVVRPDGFDLTETWKGIVATVDERRAPARVTVLAHPPIVRTQVSYFRNSVSLHYRHRRICESPHSLGILGFCLAVGRYAGGRRPVRCEG